MHRELQYVIIGNGSRLEGIGSIHQSWALLLPIIRCTQWDTGKTPREHTTSIWYTFSSSDRNYGKGNKWKRHHRTTQGRRARRRNPKCPCQPIDTVIQQPNKKERHARYHAAPSREHHSNQPKERIHPMLQTFKSKYTLRKASSTFFFQVVSHPVACSSSRSAAISSLQPPPSATTIAVSGGKQFG